MQPLPTRVQRAIHALLSGVSKYQRYHTISEALHSIDLNSRFDFLYSRLERCGLKFKMILTTNSFVNAFKSSEPLPAPQSCRALPP